MAAEIQPANPAHTNRLGREKSPYLLQHAHNPVDWYPWGEEAFEKARRENKPIFLSIGYSTCHWCHVMAHESFEDQATAAIMNRDFVNIKVFEDAYQQLDRSFDPREGGFSIAPKFPRPVALNFVTRFYARDPKSENGKHALEMDLFTLRKMAAGGMHDHIGGGFHRYSVDRYWHVPHFEKMLYDQAQLAVAYQDAFQITRDKQYESVARDILDYVARDMTSKEGGFFSAEDADSPVVAGIGDPGHSKTAEGAFYIWTKKEIEEGLGDAAEVFEFHYGVQPHGNAPEGSDPHDEFRGKNILIERHTIAETAQRFKKNEQEIAGLLTKSREKLFSIRAKRPRPQLDDKIIAAWNGLMISAYARTAQVLDDARYLEIATRAATFLRANLYDPSRKILFRNYRGSRSDIEGFADDYAFVIQGLLDLYEASFNVEWLKFAMELQQTQDRLFFDEKNGGESNPRGRDGNVLFRVKEDNDGAEPAARPVAALNLLRLSQLRDD